MLYPCVILTLLPYAVPLKWVCMNRRARLDDEASHK